MAGDRGAGSEDPEIPQVVVGEIGSDVALVDTPEGKCLVLSPSQSFSNACAEVSRVLPDLGAERVRALVRTYLPDAPELDVLPRKVPAPAVKPPLPLRRNATLACVIAASMFAATGVVLGQFASWDAPAGAPRPEASPARSPYRSAAWHEFARRGHIVCRPLGNLRARCTDWDGSVMLSEAYIASDGVVFTFLYGRDLVGLRVFDTEQSAKAYAGSSAVRALYPKSRLHGRYLLWGTDRAKLDMFEAELEKSGHQPAGVSMPGPLAAMLVGTLGMKGASSRPTPLQLLALQTLFPEASSSRPGSSSESVPPTPAPKSPPRPAPATPDPTRTVRSSPKPAAQVRVEVEPRPKVRVKVEPVPGVKADVDVDPLPSPTPTPTPTPEDEEGVHRYRCTPQEMCDRDGPDGIDGLLRTVARRLHLIGPQ